jgi:hypothetical protein
MDSEQPLETPSNGKGFGYTEPRVLFAYVKKYVELLDRHFCKL